MLQTGDSRRSLVMGEHQMGRGRIPAPSLSPGSRGRSGVKTRRGRGGGRTNTQPHTLKRLGFSDKGVQGTLGTQRGAQACATQQDAHRHLERGRPVPTTPIPGARARASRPRLQGRKADARQSSGVLGGRRSPLLRARGGRAREGGPCRQGQEGRARSS